MSDPMIAICFPLVALLTGCAAGTAEALRADPSNSIHVELDLNYQRVYKNLLGKMQECMEKHWAGVTAQYRIDHAIYTERQEANLSFVMSNLGYQNHYLQVDIKGLDHDRTKVDAFVYFSTWRGTLARVQAWAADVNSKCDVASPQSGAASGELTAAEETRIAALVKKAAN